jgi:type II secretory pathway pseudopilin PulG
VAFAAVVAAVLALVGVLSLGVAYRVGASQQAVRVAQLERELGAQGELVRDVSRRAAEAERALEAVRRELAALRQPPPDVRAGELRGLGELVDRRLRDGVRIGDLAARASSPVRRRAARRPRPASPAAGSRWPAPVLPPEPLRAARKPGSTRASRSSCASTSPGRRRLRSARCRSTTSSCRVRWSIAFSPGPAGGGVISR